MKKLFIKFFFVFLVLCSSKTVLSVSPNYIGHSKDELVDLIITKDQAIQEKDNELELLRTKLHVSHATQQTFLTNWYYRFEGGAGIFLLLAAWSFLGRLAGNKRKL